MDAKSITTVTVGLSLHPHPCSASIRVPEKSPKVPSSFLGLGPVPHGVGLDRGLVHVGHVVALVEGGKDGVVAEVALAEAVADRVGGDVGSSHGKGGPEDSSGPAVVVASVGNGVGGVLGLDAEPGSADDLRVGYAEQG